MAEPTDVRDRWVSVAATALCLAAVALTARRLLYGVDVTDECFNLALPYRFALGDRPYVDEVNPVQGAALLTWPLVELFVALRPGTDGIVLAARGAWLALTLGLGWAIFSTLRGPFSRPVAALTALIAVVWLPLGSATLSYNTLSSGFFTLGVVCALRPFFKQADERWFLFAGLAHGAAVVALHSYVLVACVCCACTLALSPRGKRVRHAALYVAGALIPVLVCLPYFLDIGEQTIGVGRGLLSRLGSASERALSLVETFFDRLPRAPWTALAIVAFLAGWRWRVAWVALAALAALPVLLWQGYLHQNSLFHVAWSGLCAPFLCLALWHDPRARVLFLGAWLPGAAAACVASYTSNNGIVNAGFGLLPGALATALLAAMAVREIAGWDARRAPLARLEPLWAATMTLALLSYQRQPYNDDPLAGLDAGFERGIFRGLHTSPEKKAWVEALQDDVESFRAPGRGVRFVTHFPAGYLMTDMPPASRSVWCVYCPPNAEWDCDRALAEDVAGHGAGGVVIFRMRLIRHGRTRIVLQRRGRVDEWLAQHASHVRGAPDYEIFLAP